MTATSTAGEKPSYDAQNEIRKLRKAVRKTNKDQGKIMFVAVYALIIALLAVLSIDKRKG